MQRRPYVGVGVVVGACMGITPPPEPPAGLRAEMYMVLVSRSHVT